MKVPWKTSLFDFSEHIREAHRTHRNVLITISNLRKKLQRNSTVEEMCRARTRSRYGKSASFHAPSGLFYLRGACVQLSGSSPKIVRCWGWGWCLGVLHTKAWLIKSLAPSDWFNLHCLPEVWQGAWGVNAGSSSHLITWLVLLATSPHPEAPTKKMLVSSKKFQRI